MAAVTDVRRMALALPGVVEKPSYGTPGFRVSDRLFARLSDDDEGVLVVRLPSEEEKAALLSSEPELYFSTPHYDGHPWVLVRLPSIDSAELTELLTDAWRARASRRLVATYDAQR